LRLIIWLVFLLGSIWAGVTLFQHPGTMTIIMRPWTLEIPLWVAAVALGTFLVLFYVTLDLIDRLRFLWFRFKNWLRFRSEHKSYNASQQGLTLLIEGRWKEAERLLLANIHESIDPLMNYLGAARAAQAQGAYDRCDQYIKKARNSVPSAGLAIGLTQAEFEISRGQLVQALATLNELIKTSPRHSQVLKLLGKVYVRLTDWQILSAPQVGLETVQGVWHAMPRLLHKRPEVVCAYVKQLLRFQDTNEIGSLIRKTLKHDWQPELVNIYGTLPFDNLNRQLIIVGAWVDIYGQKPELLLALARLCVRVKLWGKARDYYEKCLALGPNTEASFEYARLLEKPEFEKYTSIA
jgi:HemY protein